MAGHKRIHWHDDWILDNYKKYTTYQTFVDAYNKEFSEHIEVRTLEKHCINKLGIGKRKYTDEEIAFIVENYPKLGIDTVSAFKKKFGRAKCLSGIRAIANRNGAFVSEEAISRINSERRNHDSIGTLKYHGTRQRAYIKTDTGWKEASRVIWEQHNGPIPRGKQIIYLDNNPQNIDISNLAVLSRKEIGILTGTGMKSDDPEITKTSILWMQLYQSLGMTHQDLRKFTRDTERILEIRR